jgi:hypothetical protein
MGAEWSGDIFHNIRACKKSHTFSTSNMNRLECKISLQNRLFSLLPDKECLEFQDQRKFICTLKPELLSKII